MFWLQDLRQLPQPLSNPEILIPANKLYVRPTLL